MSNPRKYAWPAAVGIAAVAILVAVAARHRVADDPATRGTSLAAEPSVRKPLRVENHSSTEAPRPLAEPRRAVAASKTTTAPKTVEPLIDSPEAHLVIDAETRSSRPKSSLAMPDRLEILKERDGLVGFSTATYGATIGHGRVELALARQIRDLGQARMSYDLIDVRYGSTVLATGGDAAARASADDRTVTFARGSVEERYLLRADALEQSFVVQSLPSGRGDLVVTGRVSSNLNPPATGGAAKLAFTTQGKDVLMMSEAVAIDATGRRRDLDLAYADGKVSITVPADWLAGAVAPIVIDPLMGSALTVDSSVTDVVGSVQGVAVRVVDTAYNASMNEWLVVSQEQFGGSAFNFDIYAQRYSAAGAPVGGVIAVATSGAGEYEPTVSWASSVNKYLIAWRHDPADDASDADQFIAGRVYSWDGVAAGPAFTIDDAAGQDFGPSLAFDGTNWLCVYTNVVSATNTNVLGRFVAADGTPGAAVSVDTDTDLAASPSADFTGTTYLIAWQKGVSGSPRSIYARTMNAAGTFLTAAKAVDTSATDCVHPDVCAGGGQFLIVWQQGATAPDNNVVGRLASTSLTFAKNPFNVRATANDQLTPRSAFSASSALWYVVYSDSTTGARDIYGTRVDTTGKVTGANKLSSDVAAEVKPEIAWNSATDEMLVTWLLGDASPYQVKAQRVSMDFIVPPVPGVPTVSPNPNSTGSFTVTWAPSVDGGFSGLSNYDLQRSLNGGTSWTTIGSPVAPSFADSVPMGSYLYRVRASDNAGNTSAYSAASAAVVVDPAAPVEPLALQQYRADGVTPVAVGGSTTDGTLVLGGVIHDLGQLDGFEDSNLTLDPMWTIGAGTWAISTDGNKVVHDGTALDDFMSTPSTQSTGSWEYRFRWPAISNNTNQRAGFYLFLDSAALGGNGYRALLSAGTASTRTVSLYRVDGASETRIAGADANWTFDTNFHVLRVNRSAAGEFTLMLDGVVLGTATDATYSTAVATGLRHLSTNGNTLRVDWIRMSSAPLARSNVKLQVEVKPVGTAFDGAGLLETPFAASGSAVSVPVPLAAGSYHWRARTVDALGAASAFSVFGGNAETAADVVVLPSTPPVAPSGLIATAGDSQATLTWTGSTGATSYKVKQSLTHGGPYDAGISVPGSPYTVTGLQNGTTYFFAVTAVGAGGESGVSNEASATPQGVPAAPTNLIATGGNNQVFLSWTSPGPGVTFVVSRSLVSGSGYQEIASNVVPVTYTDNAVLNGQTYFYVVAARNAAGTGPASNEASATPNGPPPVPANFNGTALAVDSIQWTWSDVVGESGYQVHDDAHATVATSAADVPSAVEGNLLENTQYTRHVHGVFGAVPGGASNSKARYTLTRNAAPADFALTRPSAGQVNVTLSGPVNLALGATGIQLERSSDGINWTVARAFGKTLVHHDLGLDPTLSYSYRVTFRNGDAVSSAPSAPVPAPPIPPLVAPTGVVAQGQLTTILRVQWNAVTGNQGYEVHDDAHNVLASTPTEVNAVTLVGLSENSALPLHVHAKGVTALGPASATVVGCTLVHAPVSEFVLTLATPSTVRITVVPPPNPTADLTGCEIQRQTDLGWTTVKPFSNVYEVVDGPLASNASYNYRFRYQNGGGIATVYSSIKSIPVPSDSLYPPTTFQGVAQSPNSILWSWSDVPGEIGFAIQDDATATITQPGTGVLSFLESGLAENVSYARRIFALSSQGQTSGFTRDVKYTLVRNAMDADFTATTTSMSSVDLTFVSPAHPTDGVTGVRLERSVDGTTWKALKTLPGVYLFSDTGLRGSTIYQYRFSYLNGDGVASGVSPVKMATTPAATVGAVDGLFAFGGVAQVSLSWNTLSGPGVAGYNVYRSGESGGPYSKVNGSLVTSTSYIDTGLAPETTYYYVVRAQATGGGEGADSNEDFATTSGQPRTPLAYNIQGQSDTSIGILYQGYDFALVSFQVHDDNHNVTAQTGTFFNFGESIFTFEFGLTENTRYSRHVHETRAGITTPASNTVVGYTFAHNPVPDDITLSLDILTGAVVIDVKPLLNGTDGSSGVIIQRNNFGTWTTIANLTGSYSATDPNVTFGNFYTYRIQYKNVEGTLTSPSQGAGIFVSSGSPGNFAGTALSPSSIEWSWSPVPPQGMDFPEYILNDDAENEVYRGPEIAFLESVGLLENHQYQRHVHSQILTIVSPQSPNRAVYTLLQDPSASNFQVFTVSATQLRVSVTPPVGAGNGSTGCEIQRLNGATWTVVKPFSALYDFTDSGLNPAQNYTYRIRYQNGDGVPTAPSPGQDGFTGPPAPPAPTGLAGTAQSPFSIQWSWDSFPSADSFDLHDSAHNPKGQAGAGVLSLVETGLAENTAYIRHLHANGPGGQGAASLPATRYTLVHDALTSDFLLTSTSVASISVVVFGPPQGTAGLTGCRIERSDDNSTWTTVKDFSNTYGVLDTGLLRSKTYWYRVTFRNGDGVVGLPSPGVQFSTLSVSTPVVTTGPKRTHNQNTTVQGTGDAGSTVTIFFNGVADGSRLVGVGGTWSYAATTKLEGTYSVRARASSNGETTDFSNAVSIEIDLTPPPPPSHVRVTAYSNAIDVEWDPSSASDLAGYRVYRREAPAPDWSLLNSNKLVSGSKFRDATALNGHKYSYKVVALDNSTND